MLSELFHDFETRPVEKKEPAKRWVNMWRIREYDTAEFEPPRCGHCHTQIDAKAGDIVLDHCTDHPSKDVAESRALEGLEEMLKDPDCLPAEWVKAIPKP